MSASVLTQSNRKKDFGASFTMNIAKLLAATSLIVVAVDASTSIVGLDNNPLMAPASAESVKASVVSPKLAGHKTASGKAFNPHQLTAASKKYPLGSNVQVTNRKTGKKCTVKITDRGPFVKGRALDLSPAAANKVGMKGVESVSVKPSR